MVNPSLIPGDHDMFVCGNDAASKANVMDILKNWFGWKSVLDIGDLSGARVVEMIVPLWVRLYVAWQTPNIGFKIVR
jgi:predicted dinucleotide-binding enzyme